MKGEIDIDSIGIESVVREMFYQNPPVLGGKPMELSVKDSYFMGRSSIFKVVGMDRGGTTRCNFIDADGLSKGFLLGDWCRDALPLPNPDGSGIPKELEISRRDGNGRMKDNIIILEGPSKGMLKYPLWFTGLEKIGSIQMKDGSVVEYVALKDDRDQWGIFRTDSKTGMTQETTKRRYPRMRMFPKQNGNSPCPVIMEDTQKPAGESDVLISPSGSILQKGFSVSAAAWKDGALTAPCGLLPVTRRGKGENYLRPDGSMLLEKDVRYAGGFSPAIGKALVCRNDGRETYIDDGGNEAIPVPLPSGRPPATTYTLRDVSSSGRANQWEDGATPPPEGSLVQRYEYGRMRVYRTDSPGTFRDAGKVMVTFTFEPKKADEKEYRPVRMFINKGEKTIKDMSTGTEKTYTVPLRMEMTPMEDFPFSCLEPFRDNGKTSRGGSWILEDEGKVTMIGPDGDALGKWFDYAIPFEEGLDRTVVGMMKGDPESIVEIEGVRLCPKNRPVSMEFNILREDGRLLLESWKKGIRLDRKGNAYIDDDKEVFILRTDGRRIDEKMDRKTRRV